MRGASRQISRNQRTQDNGRATGTPLICHLQVRDMRLPRLGAILQQQLQVEQPAGKAAQLMVLLFQPPLSMRHAQSLIQVH